MPIERFYVEDELTPRGHIFLQGGEFHHLSRVTRTREGETIELVNGKGKLAEGRVIAIKKEAAQLEVLAVVEERAVKRTVILAQALPKPNRMDFILEKGTELGVDEFWFFPGELSIKKEVSDHQRERAQAILIAAMKQCGRLDLPEMKWLPSLKNWNGVGKSGSAFFGDTHADAPWFRECLEHAAREEPLLFFVGPESGWSEDEVALFKTRGVTGVKLHANILRTDTASLAALCLMSEWVQV